MLPALTLRQLERALDGLHYGSVHLVIHDAHVVRIERIECTRLTVTSEAPLVDDGQPTAPTEVCHEHSKE